MRRIVIIVLVALGTTVLAWETAESFYFAKPIAGRVVEWGTSTGLQDVTVVADWQLQGGLGGFDPRGHVVILETKTDTEGRFAFPRWGPRFALPRGRLIDRDPMLLFFKGGYFPRELHNRDDSNTWVRTSDWDRATVSMEPASRRPDQYADAVQNFGGTVDVSFFHPGGCAWRKIPHLLLALDREGEALSRQQRLSDNPSLASWGRVHPECHFDEDQVRRNGEWAR